MQKKVDSPEILVLNWRDPTHPFAGGAEQSLLEHVKFWSENGCKVTWFSSNYSGVKKRELIDGIEYLRYGSHYTVHFHAAIEYFKGTLGKPLIVVDSFHFIPFLTPVYMRKPKKLGLINEVAGRLWFHNLFFPLALMGYFAENICFLFYKNIIFISGSDSAKKDLIKHNIPEKNIHIVHHGVHILYPPGSIKKEKNPTLLFLGRVSKDKGIEDAIKAYMSLLPKFNNLRLWIVGKEEKIGYLKNLYDKYSITSKQRKLIKYHGFVDQSAKFRYLKNAWILIHPSRKEGWGLNVIEAASQGTPTVGYDVEGLRDSIINNKTGLLVETSAFGLAKGVQSLLTGTKTYIRLSNNSKKWASKFTWEESRKESWKIIKSLL